MNGPRTLVLLPALVLLIAAPARAWQMNPDLNDAVLQVSTELFDPIVVGDGVGGMLASSIEYDAVANRVHLTVARTGSDGTPLWGLAGRRIAELTFETALRTWIVPDGSGGAFVAAFYRPSGALLFQTYVFRVDANGNPVDDVRVSGSTVEDFEPYLASDGLGGVIVVIAVNGGTTAVDLVAHRFDTELKRIWPTSGITVCSAAGDQFEVDIAPDGSGGAFLTWLDQRNGSLGDVFASRLLADGSLPWIPNGNSLAATSARESRPVIAADGLGGAVLAWRSDQIESLGDVRVARLRSDGFPAYTQWMTNGDNLIVTDISIDSDGAGGSFVTWTRSVVGSSTPPPQIRAQYVSADGFGRWGSEGVQPAPSSSSQFASAVAADGTGAAVVVFNDDRAGSGLYAQRLDRNGLRTWDFAGIAVATGPGGPQETSLSVLDDGSVLVGWRDNRTGRLGTYAQRVDTWGLTGDPSPTITTVIDHPQDQGGRLIAEWTASDRDTRSERLVEDYVVWRRLASVGQARGIESSSSFELEVEHVVRATALAPDLVASMLISGWEYVTTVEAARLPAYSATIPSYGNLVNGIGPMTEVMVLARGCCGPTFDSLPASGISTDDLAPSAPLARSATPVDATVEIAWSPAPEPTPDLREYLVYRGASADFPISAGVLVGASSDTTITEPDPGSGTWYYRVTAVDVNDNESVPSNGVVLERLTGVDGPSVARTRLVGNQPNPFNPTTELRFELARSSDVRLEVFDTRGRRVVTLLATSMEAGAHTLRWDGRADDGSPISSGTYFARLLTADGVHTHKMVLAK